MNVKKDFDKEQQLVMFELKVKTIEFMEKLKKQTLSNKVSF